MKTVLITGASGGIGTETALLFAKRGYSVVLNYNKNGASAQETAEQINMHGGSALPVKADVSNEDEVAAMFDEAEKRFGFVNVLVNNAGVSDRGLFTDMTVQKWEQLFAVNCTGVFLCTKRALKLMISKKEGAVINISSMWGRAGASCEAAYSASKAAVIGLTKALAKEEGPSGVRINAVAPGFIKTKMNREISEEDVRALCEETPLCRPGTPEEVAEAVFFLAEHSFVTGQVLGVDGGFII